MVYKVWGKDKDYNYYGEYFMPYSDDESYLNIEDEDERKQFGYFTYAEKWSVDGETLIEDDLEVNNFPENKI